MSHTALTSRNVLRLGATAGGTSHVPVTGEVDIPGGAWGSDRRHGYHVYTDGVVEEGGDRTLTGNMDTMAWR